MAIEDRKEREKAEMRQLIVRTAMHLFIEKGVAEKIYEKQEWDVGQRSYDYLRDTVKECIEQGLIIESDIDSATFAMWGLVHGMASLIIRGRCAMMPEEQISSIVKGSLQ